MGRPEDLEVAINDHRQCATRANLQELRFGVVAFENVDDLDLDSLADNGKHGGQGAGIIVEVVSVDRERHAVKRLVKDFARVSLGLDGLATPHYNLVY